MKEEELFDTIISDMCKRCNTCFKAINTKESHIIAYKNEYPAYFCREHIQDAEHYLDWFQEFVEIK